jgi:hypothetical protein
MATYLTHWVDGNATETVEPCMDAAIDTAGAWCANEGADLMQFIEAPGHARFRAMRDDECIAIFSAMTLETA